MAIEALQQVSDPQRTAHGFHFRDVTVQKALIVPTYGSVEAQLTLRPSTVSSRLALQWSNFRICVYGNGSWAEVCSGDCGLEYVRTPIDHEGAVEEEYARIGLCQKNGTGHEACQNTVSAKDIYGHFAKLGISYGPSFATMRDIRYNEHGAMTALVNLSDWERGLVGTSQAQTHMIHPAALDAIFQSVFPALTQGGTKSFPTLVPTRFRNLWISARLNALDDAEAKIYTEADFVGF